MGRLSGVERSELWDRWEAGESQRSISRHLQRSPSTIRTQLMSAGWRRPSPPAEWCSLRLSLSEREEISRGLACDESLRSIAHRLGRAPATVSVRSRPTAAIWGIGPRWRIGHQGGERNGPRRRNLRSVQDCVRQLRRNWICGGHPVRSPGG